MSKIVAMNYRWMKKEILRTEAMPFTITQISCYISAGADVKIRTLPTCCLESNNKNTIGTTTVSSKKSKYVECSAGKHQPRQVLATHLRQEDRLHQDVRTRRFENSPTNVTNCTINTQ